MPFGQRPERHDRDNQVRDHPGRRLGDEVEGDPADGGEGREDEAIFFVNAQAVHGEEHKDGRGPVEPVVGEEEIVDALRHGGRVGVNGTTVVVEMGARSCVCQIIA